MKTAVSRSALRLAEWSPGHVRIIDLPTLRAVEGAAFAECVDADSKGAGIVVAVGQSSAFIRNVRVPDASRNDIAKILELQGDQLLPLGGRDYVLGFRLTDVTEGKGRTAVVGAIKRETLKRIYADAEAAELKVRAVLPLAFSSWLAARRHSLDSCAVVSRHGGSVAIDIVQAGELWYSRCIPDPGGAEEILDEVRRTFSICQIPTAPILAGRRADIRADVEDDRESIEYLSDEDAIGKLLFSFALPTDSESQSRRGNHLRMARALLALALALGLGAYAALKQIPAIRASHAPAADPALSTAQADRDAALARIDRANLANGILDVAFAPSQSFSDMVDVLSNAATRSSWFTALTIGRGKVVSVSGVALSDADVASFVGEVSKSPRFKDMKVVSATKGTVGKKTVTQFTVSGQAVGITPFDRPPKRSKTK